VGEVIAKIRVGKRIFEDPQFIGFAEFSEGDGFLLIIKEREKCYAIAPSTAKVYEVVERGTRLFVEIPYGGRVYRAPLRFKL
jgi:hypothetical protein